MGDGETEEVVVPPPCKVEYDPITGVPSEFNEFLPPESAEFKHWKAAKEGPEALEKLTLKDKHGNEIEKQLPGGKVKKKQQPQVVIETNTRNKKKMVTTVTGLELFGVKLAEASKIFGKKFACGCSVTKSPTGSEQIDMQGDYLQQLPEVILKNYKSITKGDVFYIEEKKKRNFFEDASDEDSDGSDA